jgi:GDP-4-dehydro-6-deoxy-D-mannose reductase
VARQLSEWDHGEHRVQLWLPNLNSRCDLLDARDVASAYARLLEAGTAGQAYNVCSCQPVTYGEVVRAMVKELAIDPEITELPAPENAEAVQAPIGDNAKLRGEAGWEPAHRALDAVPELLAGLGVNVAAARN